MQIHITDERIDYDGSQLCSHFALERFGIRGDSITGFKGAMDIAFERIADQEDRLADAAIRSPFMLHFIVELFSADLETAILKQRLLARLACERLEEMTGSRIQVEGDDLHTKEGKLSVSIAAPSPVSCLIHFGLNIETEGVPVKAAGLSALGVDPDRLALELAQAFVRELESVAWAKCKVRGVP